MGGGLVGWSSAGVPALPASHNSRPLAWRQRWFRAFSVHRSSLRGLYSSPCSYSSLLHPPTCSFRRALDGDELCAHSRTHHPALLVLTMPSPSSHLPLQARAGRRRAGRLQGAQGLRHLHLHLEPAPVRLGVCATNPACCVMRGPAKSCRPPPSWACHAALAAPCFPNRPAAQCPTADLQSKLNQICSALPLCSSPALCEDTWHLQQPPLINHTLHSFLVQLPRAVGGRGRLQARALPRGPAGAQRGHPRLQVPALWRRQAQVHW